MHEDLVNQPCLETLTGKAGTDDQQILPLCGSQACRNGCVAKVKSIR
ncbi:hypothetical protein KSD_78850 [Ktedonobacter sp. SOSP1-85]|nr:hypothetical protein KSD_78850 [Ktedonobacter sp. SOSP1-85]